jgi:hypothetical protein
VHLGDISTTSATIRRNRAKSEDSASTTLPAVDDISSRRFSSISVAFAIVVNGDLSLWLTSPANRMSRRTRVCRSPAVRLKVSESCRRSGVVRADPRGQVAGRDPRRGGVDVLQRAERPPAGPDAERRGADGRGGRRPDQDERQGSERAVELVERQHSEALRVGARKVDRDDGVRLAVDEDALPHRSSWGDRVDQPLWKVGGAIASEREYQEPW